MGILQKLSGFFRSAEQGATAPEQQAAERSVAIVTPNESNVDAPASVPEPVVAIARTTEAIMDATASAPETDNRSPLQEGKTETRATGVKRVVLNEATLSILDLRGLPSSRFRIVGSGYWVTDSGRYKHGGSDYLLVREPKNKWDANAVAVYGKGRKVGYLSEAKAAALAPIFDALPHDAYRVGGAPPADNSIRMWVDIPAVPKLRAFIKGLPEFGSSQ